MSESILRYSLTRLAQNRSQSGLSLILAQLTNLGLNLVLGLTLVALFYLPMVLAPRAIGSQLNGLSSNLLGLWPLFLSVLLGSWMMLLGQGVLSATFARREFSQEPKLSQLPVFSLMRLSLTMALPFSLAALVPAVFISSESLMLLITISLMVLTLPALSTMMMLKAQSLALTQQSLSALNSNSLKTPLARRVMAKLYGMNLLFLLLALGLGLIEYQTDVHNLLTGFDVLTGLVVMLLWLASSLLMGVFAVRAYQLIQPNQVVQASESQSKTRSYVWGLAAMAGASLLLIGGLHAYQLQELTKLEQDWQPRRQARQARVNLSRPVLRGQALPGNGSADYLNVLGKTAQGSVFTMADADQALLNQPFSAINKAQALPNMTWLAELQQRYSPQVSQLQQAMQHQGMDFQPSFKFDEALPNYVQAQSLAKLMTLEALAACQQKDCSKGLNLLLDTLRFGQDVSGQGWLIGSMVGLGIEQTAIQGFGAGFTPELRDQLSPAQYRQSLAEFQKLFKQRPTYTYALINESEMLMQMALETAQSGSESMQTISLTGEQSEQGGLAQWGGYMMMLPQFLDAYRLSRELEQDWQSLKDLPYAQLKAQVVANAPALEARMQQNLLTNIALPNYLGALDRQATGEARLKGFYLYLALQAYHRTHGSYPEDLQALVKDDLIPALPLEPFSGKSFNYRRLSPQDFRLSSPGADLKDTSAQAVFFHKDCKVDDIVFGPGNPQAHCKY